MVGRALIARAARRAGAAYESVLSLALPTACVACDRLLDAGEGGVVCGRCWARVGVLPRPQCARCGHPTGCRACRWCALLPPFVRAARSVCWVSSAVASAALHALKYEGWSAVAGGMAERMARLDWPRDVLDERAAVLPVPLAASRRRERGYNQSELLASELARRWRVPVWSACLERTRSTRTQTRLTPGERLANVAGAFRAVDAERARLRGAHVVLVDDVVTTAATLNACAAALCAGGARIVSYVTFARAPALGDRS